MTFLRIPSCSSGFIQDRLDHQVLINVGSMMYISGAYNVLFLPELLFKPWHNDPYVLERCAMT